MNEPPNPDMTQSQAPASSAGTPGPTRGPAPSWAATCVLAVVVVFSLGAAQTILVPLVVAVVLTFVLSPPVRKMRAYGIPEVVGAGLMVGALVSSGALLLAVLVGPATDWTERAPATIAQLVARLDHVRQNVPWLAPPAPAAASAPSAPAAGAHRSGRVPVPIVVAAPPDDPVRDSIASASLSFTGSLVGHAFRLAASTGATIILLFFLLASEHWVLSRTVEAVPRRRTRALVVSAVRSAQREIASYLGVQSLVNIVLGTATFLATSWLGLPSPVLWGVLAAFLNFIPYLGPMCMAAILLLAGVISFYDIGSMVAPAAAFVALHLIESNLVTPMFIGHRLSLSPIAVFISVMFWGWLWGIPGAMVAVPLLIGLRSTCKRVRRWRLVCAYLEGAHGGPPSLRSLLRTRQQRVPASGGRKRAAPATRAETSPRGPARGEAPPQSAERG